MRSRAQPKKPQHFFKTKLFFHFFVPPSLVATSKKRDRLVPHLLLSLGPVIPEDTGRVDEPNACPNRRPVVPYHPPSVLLPVVPLSGSPVALSNVGKALREAEISGSVSLVLLPPLDVKGDVDQDHVGDVKDSSYQEKVHEAGDILVDIPDILQTTPNDDCTDGRDGKHGCPRTCLKDAPIVIRGDRSGRPKALGHEADQRKH